MGNFFTKDWTGAPFELFGTAHLIGLALVALANVALFYARDHVSETARLNIRYGLVIFSELTPICGLTNGGKLTG